MVQKYQYRVIIYAQYRFDVTVAEYLTVKPRSGRNNQRIIS